MNSPPGTLYLFRGGERRSPGHGTRFGQQGQGDRRIAPTPMDGLLVRFYLWQAT